MDINNAYIKALESDFYKYFVEGQQLEHRIGKVVDESYIGSYTNPLGLDFESEYDSDDNDIIYPSG